jgi:hypothetical protein
MFTYCRQATKNREEAGEQLCTYRMEAKSTSAWLGDGRTIEELESGHPRFRISRIIFCVTAYIRSPRIHNICRYPHTVGMLLYDTEFSKAGKETSVNCHGTLLQRLIGGEGYTVDKRRVKNAIVFFIKRSRL